MPLHICPVLCVMTTRGCQGYRCIEGNPTPVPCSTGHYCPPNSQEMPCPPGTYNPHLASTSFGFCVACPAGFLCYLTGTGNYSNFPCPGKTVVLPAPPPPCLRRSLTYTCEWLWFLMLLSGVLLPQRRRRSAVLSRGEVPGCTASWVPDGLWYVVCSVA